MVNTHEGKYICGYCKKETPLDDKSLIDITDGKRELSMEPPICSCGHFSYASRITFKAQINKKDWQGWHRGSAE